MIPSPILAEDYGPVLLMVVVILVGLGVIGFVAIAVNTTRLKGRWW